EIENLMLRVEQEIRVKAPIDVTFAALLEQIGPSNERPDGTLLAMKLEPWPGGRWFRDLGNGNGHFWATLLELSGPLFMSYPVANNVQYRLSEEGSETVIKFCHAAFGLVQEAHRKNVTAGWNFIHENVRARAERART